MDNYQDAFSPAGTVDGERDCDRRWQILESHIPRSGVMVDIGSNLGYFGLRATYERPDLAVLSIEADPLIVERQRCLIEENNQQRMVLLEGAVTAASCAAWSETCDAVDAVLLLAIIHWIDDPAAAVASLSSMAGTLIAEVPHPEDAGACGQDKLQLWSDPVNWFSTVTGRPTHIIGRMDRHTSRTPSYVVKVDGSVSRMPSVAYWGSEVKHRHVQPFRIDQDSNSIELYIRGEPRNDYVPGLNLVNLMKLGALRWPAPHRWTSWFDCALNNAPNHQDPLPHNAVWNAMGLVLIDDEPRDALTTAADGRRALKANLQRWIDGGTVSGSVELRSLTRRQRLQRTDAGRWVSRHLPNRIRRLLRAVLKRAIDGPRDLET